MSVVPKSLDKAVRQSYVSGRFVTDGTALVLTRAHGELAERADAVFSMVDGGPKPEDHGGAGLEADEYFERGANFTYESRFCLFCVVCVAFFHLLCLWLNLLTARAREKSYISRLYVTYRYVVDFYIYVLYSVRKSCIYA